jgi:hypothetical protein
MGLFDTIHLSDLGLKCGHGHVCKSFQTKSLDAQMDNFYVAQGKLLKLEDRDKENEHIDIEKLELNRKFKLSPSNFTGSTRIYTTCDECDPICVEDHGESSFSDRIQEHFPWVEYILTFKAGVLSENPEIHQAQTRDEVKNDLTRRGSIVISDEDRIVRRIFSERSRRRG